MIPYGIGALIYAPLARHYSFKVILATSMAFYALLNFFCAITHSISWMLVARILMGFSAASAIPLGLILIGRLFRKKVRGRVVGLFFSCSFFSSIAGIVISSFANWRWLFVFPMLLGAVTAIFWIKYAPDTIKNLSRKPIDYLIIFKEISIRRIFFFIFIISLFYHGVHKWFGVYLNRIYYLDQWAISLFFVLMAMAGAVGQLAGGYLTDKKGRFRSCYIGILTLSIATMLLCGVYPLLILAIVLMSISIGWTIGHNGVSTVLTDLPEEYRAEIAGLNSAVRFISGGIGFSITSLFIERSFGFTFLGIGILMLFLSHYLKRVIPQGE